MVEINKKVFCLYLTFKQSDEWLLRQNNWLLQKQHSYCSLEMSKQSRSSKKEFWLRIKAFSTHFKGLKMLSYMQDYQLCRLLTDRRQKQYFLCRFQILMASYYLTEVSKTRQYRIPPLLLVNRTSPAGFP